MRTSNHKRCIGFISPLLVLGILACTTNDSKSPSHGRNSNASLNEEVTRAKDGERVTLIDWIDEKYLCRDVTEVQRDVCTTALTRTNPSGTTESLEIKLKVCSDERRSNCIVWSDPVDLRDVYVYDDNGSPIDFDGMKLVKPPNTMSFEGVKLKLTGRVTVVDGRGKLLEPIEKIESE